MLPLVLQAYNLADLGAICRIHKVYQQTLIQPAKEFDLKTFNRKLLKPEFRILFEFIHKVFISYAGSNESVSLPKFRVMSAVMKQLDVN